MGRRPQVRVWVKRSSSGFHSWPDATVRRGYLAAQHRHQFVTTVWLTVEHGDREVEFHDLLEAVERVMFDGRDFGSRSCEAIASIVMDEVINVWPGRDCVVEVSEDGECGALVSEHDRRDA